MKKRYFEINSQYPVSYIPGAIEELEQNLFATHPDAEALYNAIRILQKMDNIEIIGNDEIKTT